MERFLKIGVETKLGGTDMKTKAIAIAFAIIALTSLPFAMNGQENETYLTEPDTNTSTYD